MSVIVRNAVILQNTLGWLKVDCTSDSNMYPSRCDGNQLTGIKIERNEYSEKEEDSLLIIDVEVKVEHWVSTCVHHETHFTNTLLSAISSVSVCVKYLHPCWLFKKMSHPDVYIGAIACLLLFKIVHWT